MRIARPYLYILSLTLLFTAAFTSVTPGLVAARAADDCEGTACAQVSLTFDEEKQQYRARNNSSDRWVKVAASNLAAASSACLAPGKDEFLPLKSIVGNFRAEYSEPRCGATGGAE